MPLETTLCGCTAPSASMLTVLPSSQVIPEILLRATSKVVIAVLRCATGKSLSNLAVAIC